jgi:peptidoglycan/xylan/chitin deacetylase (PgdA/CDA1 family)
VADDAPRRGLSLRVRQLAYLALVAVGIAWACTHLDLFLNKSEPQYLTRSLPPREYLRREIQDTTRAIVKAGVPRPTLWRPPFGFTNPRVEHLIIPLGYQTALWRIDSQDYDHVGQVDVVIHNVLTHAHNGGVVLMHDGHTLPKHDDTSLRALPTIIPALRRRGYCFGTLAPSRTFSKETSEWGQGKVKVVGNGCPNLIALTFDDGPDPVVTPKMLDMFKREGIKATFFVQGLKTQQHPELVRRAYREGHVIGNHSWDHPEFSKVLP